MIAASLVQMDVAPLDPVGNLRRIHQHIATEAASGAQLILFPELANTGYVEPLVPGGPMTRPAADYALALWQACAAPDGPEIAALSEAAQHHGVHIVIGLGMRDPLRDGVMRNTSLLIEPGGVLGSYVKLHQWQNEKLYFTRGDRIDCFPFGDTRLGMQICYDIRFPEITRIMAMQGAGIVTSVWASFGGQDVPVADEGLFIHRAYTRATENGVFFLSCNRSGSHGGQRFFGRSCALAPDGTVLGALDHDGEDVLRVGIDLSLIARYRGFTGIWADRASEIYAKYL
ncbi:carbon-nitrogen hydrolase family protein [Paracoccus methylovorus]|uniref:Predicted amidohydrolase n=2 Tax=Paracoccus TaxID=265 RepID=A0A1H8KII5_9RHOB|nr:MULTISPECIES: carbon-nitrogen hydrolase family protein [Paracoccus]QRZ12847.1 carbon-nitrogen hydrolase family protein [Paracoccus methylovorus]WCR18942.1 carbon-nitrogen hydrolase family protein [Paracoccus alcaliphilus]SEN92396.1 Predicted amidohydrolase [Paracoccus alcaliphilus]